MTPETIEIPGGFIVPANDSHIGKWQQECGRLDHDEFLIPIVCQLIHPGMTVLDGGAFDGDHTIEYVRRVGEIGRVVAVECGKLAFECLVHNRKLFAHPMACNTIKMALGDKDFEVFHHVKSDNLGASHLAKVGVLDAETEIATITIDRLAEIFNLNFDYIKLDIEGYEPQALRGAKKQIEKNKPFIVLEWNRHALERAGNTTSFGEQLPWIQDIGYRVFSVPGVYTQIHEQQDMICYHPDRDSQTPQTIKDMHEAYWERK